MARVVAGSVDALFLLLILLGGHEEDVEPDLDCLAAVQVGNEDVLVLGLVCLGRRREGSTGGGEVGGSHLDGLRSIGLCLRHVGDGSGRCCLTCRC